MGDGVEWIGEQQLKATVALVTCCLLFGWLPSATTVCLAIRCVPTSHDTLDGVVETIVTERERERESPTATAAPPRPKYIGGASCSARFLVSGCGCDLYEGGGGVQHARRPSVDVSRSEKTGRRDGLARSLA